MLDSFLTKFPIWSLMDSPIEQWLWQGFKHQSLGRVVQKIVHVIVMDGLFLSDNYVITSFRVKAAHRLIFKSCNRTQLPLRVSFLFFSVWDAVLSSGINSKAGALSNVAIGTDSRHRVDWCQTWGGDRDCDSSSLLTVYTIGCLSLWSILLLY